jgi:lipopolysaccharide transport system ATP-binding protein
MSESVIRVSGLGKRYRIGQGGRHNALRNLIGDALRAPVRLLTGSSHSSNNHPSAGSPVGNGNAASGVSMRAAENGRSRFIWALKDVNFEVHQGEAVGIIGRNGAGKSTLLKILARITRPTEGHAEIHGRVGSLLEVGTGFHPELTGRENVYMSGAILGMRKAEIDRKFDEIVAFSEVERFLETPLKHYSSGMQMRLAFAVAAHLDPEILFVDEVLAVGDAAFQKKCLGKMSEVTNEGRTILFVSHNATAMQSLCSRAILLKDGLLLQDGPFAAVISEYFAKSTNPSTESFWPDQPDAPGNDIVRIRRVSVRPNSDLGTTSLDPELITVRTPLVIEFEYWNLKPRTLLNLSLLVHTEDGVLAFNTGPVSEPVWQGKPFPVGLFRSVCYMPGDLLNDGFHRLTLLVIENQAHIVYRHEDVLTFEVQEDRASRKGWYGDWPGATRPALRWTTELVSQGTLPQL